VSDELLLAIDAGTGSARAVLFTPDGAVVATGQREYSHRPLDGVPGSHVFDTAANWALICACIRQALAGSGADPSSVRAVSATSMREGMVLYDASGAEIWACPNVDGRAGTESAELIARGEAQEIFDRAGDWVSITAPPRWLWIARNEPDIFAATRHVTMLGDWILQRLSGVFVTDPSLGSSSAMFDLAERDWSGRILEICGVRREIFPEVVDSGTVIGGVTARAAAETGLREGTPVVVGGADTQLALAGLGVTGSEQVTVVGGTFWQHTIVLDTPLVDPGGRLRTLCHTTPGRWMMEGIGFYCGMAMRWFRDAFCELEVQEAARDGVDVYAVLERKAARCPPGANGVVGIFSDVMQTDRWIHASPTFMGFDVDQPGSSGRIECFRAIEESAAYVCRGHHAIVEELLGATVDDVVMCGGAAKGELWPQIIADVLGRPISIPAVIESAALGAALYAGVGAGLIDDATAHARRIRRYVRRVDPDPAATEAYARFYDRWRELYRRSLEISEAGLSRPLWRAAGA
jgi:autoinducer 2 (AI-2) kinase